MKIKTAEMPYEEVQKQPSFKHVRPERQSAFFRFLLKTLSAGELKKVNFTYEKIGMERLKPGEPCLVLMNHSSFIDLKIASTLLADRSFHIVCTNDGFVGKDWLMRKIGCIPTRKFISDVTLVKDMVYATKELKSSILMFPEASYSFDGTETPLPDSLGKCMKLLRVPVVLIQTRGAFARDPLYNNLQLRSVNVSAKMKYLFSPEDLKAKDARELNEILKEEFRYDHFRWQQENKISISESFRGDFLNRVLYKCPSCHVEGKTRGKGIHLTCHHCDAKWELTEFGFMKKLRDGDRAKEDAAGGDDATLGMDPLRENKASSEMDPLRENKASSEMDPLRENEVSLGMAPCLPEEIDFSHIPDWYRWERDCVRRELEQGTYLLDVPVDIYMLVNTDCVYKVGEGNLTHNAEGFHLTGCEGKLDYRQAPQASYGLYADYYWYEIGDMICIGDEKAQYYCFPKTDRDIVAKTRLATEELYRISR